MKLRKRMGVWHYRFMVRGKLYRGSTELGNHRDAQTAAEKIRTEIVMGNLGILERGPAPELREFLNKAFLPYVAKRHKDKPKTADYYKYGAGQLLSAKIAKVRLDAVTDKDVADYIEERINWTPSGVNQGLRTLRRALKLAYEWHKIDRKPTISLAQGERQRDRVISIVEQGKYLACCREPWKTMATILVELGLRPGEIFKLKVDDLNWDDPAISISSGKTKAARRTLPMTDGVYKALLSWTNKSNPTTWLFESPRKHGRPYNQQRAFDWHHEALEKSGVDTFEPYSLRHTALTRIGDKSPNPYTVAAIAGHTSITTTQRYVHTEKAAIQSAIEEISGLKFVRAARKRNFRVVNVKGKTNG
jgi:integrase